MLGPLHKKKSANQAFEETLAATDLVQRAFPFFAHVCVGRERGVGKRELGAVTSMVMHSNMIANRPMKRASLRQDGYANMIAGELDT